MRFLTIVRILAVLTLTLGLAAPVAAADGTVTFRLTIRGTPPATDSFTLGLNPDNGLIVDAGVRCGPGSDLYNPSHVPCEARNYDFSVTLPAGTEITYTYARYLDYLASGGASGSQVHLEGSITVAEYPQTVTLVYDYTLGTSGGASTQPLPDTRVAPLPSSNRSWVTVVALMPLLALVAYSARRARGL